jgi:DNA-binding MarR family transcriptional regulator
MTTSTVLRTLQKKGLVNRQEHLTDTRAKTVVLTAKGRETTKLAVKSVEMFDTLFFESLGDKTKEFNNKLIKLINQTIV